MYFILIASLILTGVLLWASVNDLKTQEIPDMVHVILLFTAATGMVMGDWITLKDAAQGFAVGGLLILVMAMFGKMGFGDVKLLAVLGAWLGTADIVNVFMLSFLYAFVPAIYNYSKFRDGKRALAFGPFIACAALTVWYTPFRVIDFSVFI